MSIIKRSGRQIAIIATVVVLIAVVAASVMESMGPLKASAFSSPPKIFANNSRTPCIFPANSLADLNTFSAQTGKKINCALVYDNAVRTWPEWAHPWVLHPPRPDADLVGWKEAVPGRRLILSQPMVPDEAPANWRVLGAEGVYDRYATQLAQNLVAGGLGDSIIRLGWEANGDFNQETALGTDPSQYGDWAAYWANVVRAMRSVHGAHFLFDWTINETYRPIPLASWYPGNDVVDIIGVDVYDGSVGGATSPAARFQTLYNTPVDGLGAIAAFAKANGKPMSIPEWGLISAQGNGAAGDDPAFMEGLAKFMHNNDVIYESYFDHPEGDLLNLRTQTPQSLAIYESQFSQGVHLRGKRHVHHR